MRKALLLLVLITQALSAQIGINNTNPDTSAALDIVSTDSGILIPRLTETQRTAISAPATGLLVYQTNNVSGFWYYDGIQWIELDKTPSWNLTGNAGTDPNVNFLGTTDDLDIIFRRNNLRVAFIGDDQIAFGTSSLAPSSTGSQNIALGNFSLRANTTGYHNIAIGSRSLYSNIDGNSNIAVGLYSLQENISGTNNIAIGRFALKDNLSEANVAIGNSALILNTSGEYNIAIGRRAMNDNTTGSYNTVVGADSGLIETGNYNTVVGYSSGSSTAGSNNVIIGAVTGSAGGGGGQIGNNNIIIGAGAMASAGGLSNEIRIGNTSITSAGIQVAWTITSDERWKESVRNLPYGLNFISRLRPVDYFRKEDNSGQREVGFIAQEVHHVLKELGIDNMGLITQDGNGYYGMRYNDLIGILVQAMQEQQQIIASQKKKITDLESRIATIEQLLLTSNSSLGDN